MRTYLPQWVVIIIVLGFAGLVAYLSVTNIEKAYPVILLLSGIIGAVVGVGDALRRGNDDK